MRVSGASTDELAILNCIQATVIQVPQGLVSDACGRNLGSTVSMLKVLRLYYNWLCQLRADVQSHIFGTLSMFLETCSRLPCSVILIWRIGR